MKRKKMSYFKDWKEKEAKPILLIGARQVGKSFLCLEFAKEFKNSIYVNLERDSNLLEFLKTEVSAKEIISYLELSFDTTINDETLIIFDEIQLSPNAITSLKYFNEDYPKLKVIGSGSLLGTMINRESFSFPVGKVDIQYLQPFDFEEFLWAIGKEKLCVMLYEHYESLKPMNDAYHNMLLQLYKEYLVVGGMPEAILNFKNVDRNLNKFDRSIHEKIIFSYIADMGKYTSSSRVVKNKMVYNSIVENMKKENLKYMYSKIDVNAKARDYEDSVNWLVYSNIALRVNSTNSLNSPISAYSDKKMFKLFYSDIGLLNSIANVKIIDIINETPNIFKGAIAENFVAQQLSCNFKDLFYFKNNKHEIDFLVENESSYIIEVKAGSNTISKSLNYAIDNNISDASIIKLSTKNFGKSDFISIPIYAAFCIK